MEIFMLLSRCVLLLLTALEADVIANGADGITVRFMNSDLAGNNLTTSDQIKAFVARVGPFSILVSLANLSIDQETSFETACGTHCP